MFCRFAIIVNPRKRADHCLLSGDHEPAFSSITGNRASFGLLKMWLLVMVFGWLGTPGLANAQSDNIPAVNLIAPEPVRELLAKYFVLPNALIKNDSERSIFMRSAQREIAELLSTEGYFSAKAVLRSVSAEGVLELEVIPGPRTVVTEVNIEFRGDLSLPEARCIARVQQLRAAWSLQSGKPFRAAAWDEAKADLLAQVASEDYAAARIVESSAQVNAGKASASLRVVIDSGPRFLFGELQVSGLERYDELLVSRYATFSRGQPYRRDLLLSFQTRLQNLRQFSSVIVNLDTASGKTSGGTDQGVVTAPVKVQIVEALSRKISIGIGYSSNNGLRNEVSYESYNFLNHAWILNTALVVEQNRQTVSAGLAAPPNPVGYQLKWAGSAERTQIQGLETRSNKFNVIRSRTLFDIETGIGPYWQQEQQIPEGGTRQTAQALVIDWYWNRRKVDNPLFPMSGSLTQVRLGGATKSLLSDQDYVRSYLRYQMWIPLGESDVVSLRIEGGYTAATSSLGIPQDYLFRVGGTQTVRGFAYQSLGVRDGDAVVGGRVMATGSAEYTHWFGKWGAALFCDTGGAADVVPELRMSLGYGIGARWRSPVGPLALDFARGKGQPGSRIHFSIAVAF
jgi:translocation and assembly module TamA